MKLSPVFRNRWCYVAGGGEKKGEGKKSVSDVKRGRLNRGKGDRGNILVAARGDALLCGGEREKGG